MSRPKSCCYPVNMPWVNILLRRAPAANSRHKYRAHVPKNKDSGKQKSWQNSVSFLQHVCVSKCVSRWAWQTKDCHGTRHVHRAPLTDVCRLRESAFLLLSSNTAAKDKTCWPLKTNAGILWLSSKSTISANYFKFLIKSGKVCLLTFVSKQLDIRDWWTRFVIIVLGRESRKHNSFECSPPI